MMKRIAILILVLTAFAGCRTELPYQENPFENIRRVAVAPFSWYGGIKIPATKLQEMMKEPGEVFATELDKFPGFEVIRPAIVEGAMEKHGISLRNGGPQAALKLAEELEADAIIVGQITDCDPYRRPRLGVALQMFSSGGYNVQNIDWNKVAPVGRPFGFSADVSRRPIIAVEKIFDAKLRNTYERVMEYAEAHLTEDRPLEKETYVKILKYYFQFVSYEVINDILYVERARQMETMGIDYETEVFDAAEEGPP